MSHRCQRLEIMAKKSLDASPIIRSQTVGHQRRERGRPETEMWRMEPGALIPEGPAKQLRERRRRQWRKRRRKLCVILRERRNSKKSLIEATGQRETLSPKNADQNWRTQMTGAICLGKAREEEATESALITINVAPQRSEATSEEMRRKW